MWKDCTNSFWDTLYSLYIDTNLLCIPKTNTETRFKIHRESLTDLAFVTVENLDVELSLSQITIWTETFDLLKKCTCLYKVKYHCENSYDHED